VCEASSDAPATAPDRPEQNPLKRLPADENESAVARCETVPVTLLDDLAALAGTGDDPVVLSARRGVLVVRTGELVVKAHRDGTDETELRRRLTVGAHPLMSEILVPPHGQVRKAGGRLVTVWPAGRPVDPGDPAGLPWAEGARLLARLHAVPADAVSPGAPAEVPAARGPVRVARAVARLPGAGAAADQIRRAYAVLPAWVRGGEPSPGGNGLVHGDWHLGQLVRTPGAGWRLIDLDDLGVGDPVWDLARPAALYAAGVLPPADWETFCGAYRGAGGRALPAHEDPWARLNIPAQALAVQIAATCVVMAAEEGRRLDDNEAAVVETCGRIATSNKR
jgi:aminoglycoside phosphotransferase (APT) family kinase protein